MDNKQGKLSCYGNYSKWQQSPGYLLPHLHISCPHPPRAFLEGCIKLYAARISIAQTGRDLLFTTALPGRIIHLFPFSLCFSCRPALPGWLPHSVLPRVGNLKYRLELLALNTPMFSLPVTTAPASSSAPFMFSMCLRYFTKGVAKGQISQGN